LAYHDERRRKRAGLTIEDIGFAPVEVPEEAEVEISASENEVEASAD
jgi:hypothetical protein